MADTQTVSLAVLDTKLDAVLSKLVAMCGRQDDCESRLRDVELKAARHTERLGMIAAGLIALQLIGSIVAAVIGTWLR